jgi:hypothetical protein
MVNSISTVLQSKHQHCRSNTARVGIKRAQHRFKIATMIGREAQVATCRAAAPSRRCWCALEEEPAAE